MFSRIAETLRTRLGAGRGNSRLAFGRDAGQSLGRNTRRKLWGAVAMMEGLEERRLLSGYNLDVITPTLTFPVENVTIGSQQFTLTPGSAGYSLAMDDVNGWLLVGAPDSSLTLLDASGNPTTTTYSSVGAAYVFNASSGALLHTLFDPNPTPQEFGSLGKSVAIVGNDVLVGAPDYNGEVGAVFVFDGGGNLLETLSGSTFSVNSAPHFGVAMATFDPTRVIVGAEQGGIAAGGGFDGQAYLIQAIDTSGLPINPTVADHTFSMDATGAQTDDFGANDSFGDAIAVSANMQVLIGAKSAGTVAGGAAVVYTLSGDDPTKQTNWSDAVIPNPVNVPNIYGTFGAAVAFAGSAAVIGDPGADFVAGDGSAVGKVYIYATPTSTPQVIDDPLTADTNTIGGASFAGFGGSLAATSSALVVGAPTTGTIFEAYAYDISGGVASFGQAVTDLNDPNASFGFGGAVALSAGRLFVGNNFTNSVSIYDSSAPTPAELSGLVWIDFNNNGEVDLGEEGIPGASVTLTGTDALNNSITPVTVLTDADGFYDFIGLAPGTYTISASASGFVPGLSDVGSAGGTAQRGTISNISLGIGQDGTDYNFGELPISPVAQGQSAPIGFWQNKNGQALINAFNGGPASTQLGNWLAATLPNIFGALAGVSNSGVASAFKARFTIKGMKLDAQLMATALSVYATNATLGGPWASSYGFVVGTADNNGFGLGNSTYNVGSNGAAFAVPNNTTLTVMQILQAADAQAVSGVLYGGISVLRNEANAVFAAINQAGSI